MISPLLALAILGVPAAAAGAASLDIDYYYEEIHRPFFRKDEGAGYWVPARRGNNASRFAVKKSSDAFRVFVLGGSVAARSMGQDVLEARLQKALPTRTVEAVNCGMGGYDSAREALVLKEVLGHEPDLIVLLSGHNEMIAGPPVAPWLLRLRLFLNRWPAWRALNKPAPFQVNSERAEARNEALRANHRRMLAAAKARGVPVLSISPPLCWRDCPTSYAPPFLRPTFASGHAASLRGERERALDIWERSLAELTAPADTLPRSQTLFHMARTAEALARQETANALYIEAMEADWVTKGRCGPRCSAVIRDVAAEAGVDWFDLDALFRARAAPRLPGVDIFSDEVHWLHPWNAFAAVAVIEAIARGRVGAGLPWDERALAALRAEAARRPALEERDVLETLRFSLISMRRPDHLLSMRSLVYFDRTYERRPAWFSDLAVLAARAADDGSGPGAAWGMGPLSPSLPHLHWYAGEVLLRRGRASRRRSPLIPAFSARRSAVRRRWR